MSPVLVRDPPLHWFFEILVGSGTGFPRSRTSALSLSTDGEIGIEPVLSCGNDVGVADELDEEEAVDKPGTTTGTYFSVLH